MRSVITRLVVVALFLGMAPAAMAAPADGNGKKLVFELDEHAGYDCGDDQLLDLHFGGWFQAKAFQGNGNRNIELAVFHIVMTFTNSEGETFVYNDVGPDHAYIDKDGNFVVTITGRPGNLNGEGFSLNGHAVVVNGDLVWYAGNEGPIAEDQACAALT